MDQSPSTDNNDTAMDEDGEEFWFKSIEQRNENANLT